MIGLQHFFIFCSALRTNQGAPIGVQRTPSGSLSHILASTIQKADAPSQDLYPPLSSAPRLSPFITTNRLLCVPQPFQRYDILAYRADMPVIRFYMPLGSLHTPMDNVAHAHGRRCTRPRTTLHTPENNERPPIWERKSIMQSGTAPYDFQVTTF